MKHLINPLDFSVEETEGTAKNRAAHIGGPAAGAGGGAAAGPDRAGAGAQ